MHTNRGTKFETKNHSRNGTPVKAVTARRSRLRTRRGGGGGGGCLASDRRLLPLSLQFSHHTPLLTVTGRPRRENGFRILQQVGFPGSSHPATRPHAFFLAQRIKSCLAAQGYPRKLPILQEESFFSPDQFCPKTFRARLSTSCSHCSDEKVPSLSVHETTSLSRSGFFFGQPCLHVSPKSGKRLQLETETFSSAIKCKPIRAPCFQCLRGDNVPEFHRGSVFMKKKSSPCGPYFPGTIPDAGCRAKSQNIPRIQKQPHPFPAVSFPHLLQNLCTDQIGRHPSRQGHKQRIRETRSAHPSSAIMNIVHAI